MTRTILHCDMDAFFAAVEVRENPALRGKPVVIGADPKGGKGRGVVSTASYEARRFGVRSALPIGEAFRRCPHAVFLRPNGKLYGEASEKIFAVFARYSPLVEIVSVDEAFLDATGEERLFGSGEEIARRIQADILREERLTVSVGVAPNKFLAKVASDMNKPNGITVVPPGEERKFLAPLPVEKLWGVGEKTAAKLRALGFERVGDLARRGEETLVRIFGDSWGAHLHRLSLGLDDRPVEPGWERKSMSREHTFEKDTKDLEEVRKTLLALSQSVARRLRKEGFAGKTVHMKLRYAGFETLSRDETLPHFVETAEDIFHAAWTLFEAAYQKGRAVRLVGAGVAGLVPAERAARMLFEAGDASRKIAKGEDAVVNRFGKRAVTRAALLPPPAGRGRRAS